MKEHTIALLTECEAGLKMATGSMEQTLPKLSDPGFKTMFQDYYTKHTKLQEECKRQLKEQQKEEDQYEKNPPLIAKLMSDLKIAKCEDMGDVADFYTDGCNMGMKTIAKCLNKYMQASEESISLARKVIKMEQHFMEDLRAYL